MKSKPDVDWERIRNTTEDEIDAQIAEDPDTAPHLESRAKLRWVFNPPLPDVKAIRRELKLSQAQFAARVSALACAPSSNGNRNGLFPIARADLVASHRTIARSR
jgi:hypothetical protein